VGDAPGRGAGPWGDCLQTEFAGGEGTLMSIAMGFNGGKGEGPLKTRGAREEKRGNQKESNYTNKKDGNWSENLQCTEIT